MMNVISKSLMAAGCALVLGMTVVSSFAQTAEPRMTYSRAEAIHDCSAESSKKMPEYTWGVQQLDWYRACMARHGMNRE